MKGKLSTKTIIIAIITALLLALAVSGTVLFLKDSGEASAAEEGILPVAGNNTEEGDSTEQSSGNEGTENRGQTTSTSQITGIIGDEPAASTVEQERVIAEQTKLGWNNLAVEAEENDYTQIEINYNNLKYTVEYYFDGKIDEELTEVIGKNPKGKVIDTYIDKIKDGYKLEKVENLPLTISENENNNVIKVYYTPRTDLTYKVYYKELETEKELQAPKVVSEQIYGTKVTEEAVEIDGYNKVDPTSAEIEITTGENKLTFYYTVRKDLSYTVYYKELETEKELEEPKVVSEQTYGTKVVEEAVEIDGYNKVDPTSAEIEMTTGENKVTFYYTLRKDLSYTVYYKELETEKELQEPKVVSEQTYGTKVVEEAVEIDGYNKVDPTSTEVEITTGENKLTFYYTVRKDLSYTVYYKELETEKELEEPKVVSEQTYGTKVVEEAVEIDGYNKVDPTSTEVEITTGENKITFYYTARTDLSYTVYYKELKTEKELQEPKVVSEQTYGTKVTEEAVEIDGYNKVDPTSAEIEITTGENKLTFYYTPRTDLSYTVYYKEIRTEKEIKTAKVVSGQVYGTKVVEEAVEIDGYNKVDSTSAEIEITTGENKITFYYTPRTDLSYTVYYKEIRTEKELKTAKVVSGQTYEAKVAEEAVEIEGYNKVDPTSAEIEITTGENKVTFYYTPKTDLTYTVYYKEIKTEKEIKTAKVVSGQIYGTKVTETAADIDGYNKVDPTSAEIEITTGENKITFYYTPRTDLSYTVYYKELRTEKELKTAKVVTGQTYGTKVAEEAVEIEGYNKVDPTSAEIEITAGENKITFYYTPRTDLSYTVYYKEIKTEKEIKTAKVVSGQIYGTKVTEEAVEIEGYNKVDPTSAEVEITIGENKVTFYYTPRTDLSYTVYYKELGTEKEIKTAKVVSGQTYGTKVVEIAAEIEGYNKVDPTSAEIEITAGENKIIFYYEIIKYPFTIKYYYNNVEDRGAKIEGTAPAGTIITIPDKSKDGFRKYSVPTDTEIKASQTENVFKVYYGKPEVEISKTAQTQVNYGENIHYVITVTNSGFVGTSVTVSDTLQGTVYKDGSSTESVSVNENVLTWEIQIPAATANGNAVKTIEFDAIVPDGTPIGTAFKNNVIANTKENEQHVSEEIATKIKEFDVTYDEYKEGKTGEALNIIFIIDNSSSMNEPIAGKKYTNNESNAVAPTDREKTRIESAKSAIQSFITSQSNNTMTVIKYNDSSEGNQTVIKLKGTGYTTTRVEQYWNILEPVYYKAQIGEKTIQLSNYGSYGYVGSLDGKGYILGTDGLCYEYEKVQEPQGPLVVGTTMTGKTGTTNNAGLSTSVSNMTIGDLRSSFGTYVGSAFDEAKKYLDSSKTNVVIVLSDGAFNGSNYGDKAISLINSGADYIYSVAFGADADISKLKEVTNIFEKDENGNATKNKKVYTAENASTLLAQFKAIEEEASGAVHNLSTENGEVVFAAASNTIQIKDNCPITAYITGKTTKLFESKDITELKNKYGIEISEDGKTLSWNANVFIANNPDKIQAIIDGDSKITIKYYIPNSK